MCVHSYIVELIFFNSTINSQQCSDVVHMFLVHCTEETAKAWGDDDAKTAVCRESMVKLSLF